MGGKNKHALKWSPAVPVIKEDNIKTETVKCNPVHFKPSYEDEPRVYINFLLKEEYRRVWFSERDALLKKRKAKEAATRQAFLQRRYVRRSFVEMRLPKNSLKIIKLKRFQNIQHKVDTRRRTPPTTTCT